MRRLELGTAVDDTALKSRRRRMVGGFSASIFGSAMIVIYAPASRAQEQSNTNDVIAKLESAAKYHPAESVVLDLFDQMDNSNDPV